VSHTQHLRSIDPAPRAVGGRDVQSFRHVADVTHRAPRLGWRVLHCQHDRRRASRGGSCCGPLFTHSDRRTVPGHPTPGGTRRS